MKPTSNPSSRMAELEKLRRELLRRIMASEARRQAARGIGGTVRSPSA